MRLQTPLGVGSGTVHQYRALWQDLRLVLPMVGPYDPPIDYAPNRHVLTLAGNTALTGHAALRVLDFDGTGDYATIPDDDSLDITADITIAALVYVRSHTTGNDENRIALKGTGGHKDNLWTLDLVDVASLGSGLRPSFMLHGPSGPGDSESDGVANGVTLLSHDTWYLIVCTYDGATMSVYLDGRLDHSHSSYTGTGTGNASSVVIGGRTTNIDMLDGQVAFLGVWARALTAHEVALLHRDVHGMFRRRRLASVFAATQVAGTPVSNTQASMHEALAAVSQEQVAEHEAVGQVEQSGVAEHEALQAVEQSETAEHEALEALEVQQASAHEALGAAEGEQATAHEARGAAEQEQVSRHEALQELEATQSTPHEALESVEQSQDSEHEALEAVEQEQVSEYESLETAGAVSQTQVSWYEALANIEGEQEIEHEALASASQTQDSQHEALETVSNEVVSVFEVLQLVEQTEEVEHEARGLVSVDQVAHHEAVSQVSAEQVVQHEALTSLLQTLISLFEALEGIEQSQVSAFEAEGIAPLVPTDLDIEAQDFAFEIIQELGKDVIFQAAGGPVTVRVSPPIRHLQRFVRRTSVRHGAMQLIIPAKNLTFTPTKLMIVEVDGVKSRILQVDPVKAGNLTAVYIASVRMGGQEFVPSSRETILDVEMVPVILELLEDVGITATVTETSVTSYDPLTDIEVVASPVVHTVLATPPFEYEDAYVDGSVIKASDQVSFIRAKDLTFRPREGRELVFASAGESWKIVAFGMVPTGEQVGLWELQLRK